MLRNLLKVNRKTIRAWGISFGVLLLAVTGLWLVLVYFEGEEPILQLSLTSPYIGSSRAISLHVSDQKSGIRSVWVALTKDGKEFVVLDRRFERTSGIRAHDASLDIRIDPVKLGVSDGPALLRMVARDYSGRRWWHGNITYLEKEVFIDTRPPGISVLSRPHYVNQGGAGLVIYRLTEKCPQSGVKVGDRFFPGHNGYFDDHKIFMSFFALGVDQGPGTRMVLSATDPADNLSETDFHYSIRRKTFKKDVINITDGFLQRKVPEISTGSITLPGASILDQFVWANRNLRREDYRKVTEIAGRSKAVMHWKGAFLRLPKSARKAGFGESRQYRYKGRVVDRQIHRGIDLASVPRSQVPAANYGQVVYAGLLGIYGKTVVIDHGFGLLSTYSHLSRIDVKVNQMVSKGDIIGRTGSTGLAGGDHLHFGVFVHSTFVNPLEWWDAAWLKNNIMAKIEAVQARWH